MTKITADFNPDTGWCTIRKTVPNTEYMGIVYEKHFANVESATKWAKTRIKSLEKMYGLKA